jgi:hypothetical protein
MHVCMRMPVLANPSLPAADRCCMLGQVIVVGEMSTVWEVAELQVYGVLFSEAQTTK